MDVGLLDLAPRVGRVLALGLVVELVLGLVDLALVGLVHVVGLVVALVGLVVLTTD